jgi:hypothetical protein
VVSLCHRQSPGSSRWYFGRIPIAWITSSEPSTASEGDDLEEIGVARRTQVQAQLVVEVVDRHGVSCRLFDVRVGDAVLARRRVNLHTESYYETSRQAEIGPKTSFVGGEIHNLRIERVIDFASDARFPRLAASTGATRRVYRASSHRPLSAPKSAPENRGTPQKLVANAPSSA